MPVADAAARTAPQPDPAEGLAAALRWAEAEQGSFVWPETPPAPSDATPPAVYVTSAQLLGPEPRRAPGAAVPDEVADALMLGLAIAACAGTLVAAAWGWPS